MARFGSFVVMAAMRTGSNLLEAQLNALPGVRCEGEAFNPHFIGALNRTELHGITLVQRDADPLRLLSEMRARGPRLTGFRYFHDHDPRIFPAVMDDPACAKIVLTRNPLDSYVSWKIARATGQWKLTDPRQLRTARIRFDGPEFERFVADLQAFHRRILHGLQVSGQTAFWLAYEDVQDLAVLNGLAAWLGVEGRLEALDPALRKQNPEPLEDRVENPAEMAAALARLDRWDLSRTPVFEPRRSPAVPSWMAAGRVLFMPVPGGPVGRVRGWLAGLGPVQGDFVQATLRQWRRAAGTHRSFTVVRHPLLRAAAAFEDRILKGGAPEVRQAFQRTMGLRLPPPPAAQNLSEADRAAAFLAFLRFARLNLSGQTAVRVDAAIATQTAVIQGFAATQAPDLILREDRLAEGLSFLAAETGHSCPDLPAPDLPTLPVASPEAVQAAREAWARDYQGFGFDARP